MSKTLEPESTVSVSNESGKPLFGTSLKTIGMIVAVAVAGALHWNSLQTMNQKALDSVAEQKVANEKFREEIVSAIETSAKAYDEKLATRFDQQARIQEAEAKLVTLQREHTEKRITAAELTLNALSTLPAAVSAQNSRIDKLEYVLEVVQQMRVQMGTMSVQMTNMSEQQAEMKRTVDKLAGKQ